MPSVKALVDEAIRYITQACHAPRTYRKEGWRAFYEKNYWGNYLLEKLPLAYLGSADPIYGKMMGAAVKGLTQRLMDTSLEKPSRPAIGAYGPWFSHDVMRLLSNYDLMAGTGVLSPEEEAAARHAAGRAGPRVPRRTEPEVALQCFVGQSIYCFFAQNMARPELSE